MLPFEDLEITKTKKQLSDLARIEHINAELRVFLKSIGFIKEKATIRDFDRFYRDRNDGQTVERFIETRLRWSTLLRENGIEKRIERISKENIINNLVEFCSSVLPTDFSRVNFFKYYTDKNGVSPVSALKLYKWESLISSTGIKDRIKAGKEKLLEQYGKEFALNCKIQKRTISVKDFKRFLYEKNPDLNVFSITNSKAGWSSFLKRIGESPRVNIKVHSDEYLLDKLYEAYCKNGNKQPTKKNIEDMGISPNTFNRFGGFYSAIGLMYSMRGIPQEVKKNIKSRGNNLDELGEIIPALKYIGLMEGPATEQGVVCLFSKIHFILGFPQIIKCWENFPDCKAISIRDKSDKRVNIEFKKRSSSWRKSGPPELWNAMIQYLVCWEHDSKDFEEECYKVELIELKKEVLKDDFLSRISNYYRTERIMKESGK